MPKLEFHHWQTYLRAEQQDERSQASRIRRRSMEILHDGRIQQRYGGIINYLEDSKNRAWIIKLFLYRRLAPDEGRCAQSTRDARGRTVALETSDIVVTQLLSVRPCCKLVLLCRKGIQEYRLPNDKIATLILFCCCCCCSSSCSSYYFYYYYYYYYYYY